MSEKVKTSISIEKETWQDWVKFVVNKTGSVKTVGSETELALQEYMKRHPLDKK